MRRLISSCAVVAIGVLTLTGCPASSGQQGGAVTGPGTGTGAGTDTSNANTPDQMEELQRSVNNGLRNALNRCYTEEMERKKDKKLAGHVSLQIQVGVNERADQVAIVEHTLKSAEFDACVLRTTKSWEFPKLNSATGSTFTFEFSPAY